MSKVQYGIYKLYWYYSLCLLALQYVKHKGNDTFLQSKCDTLNLKISHKHIVITGPESTGKTTLATFLSKKYNACLVPEIARNYLANLNRPYEEHDVLHMASLQFQAQLNKVDCSLLISDTSLLNYLIWMEVKYGYVHPQIEEWFYLQQIDAYLLLAPDLDWEEDPLRENPTMLNELFEMYYKKLTDMDVPFFIIEGVGNQRNEHAKAAFEELIVH